MEQSRKKGMALMAVSALLWSISGVLIKHIPWNPVVIAGWRSLFASLVFVCYFRRKRYRLVLTRQTLLCALTLAGSMLLYIAACKLTTSANAIILQSTSPVFIMLLDTVFLKHRYRRAEYAMVAVVLGGIGLFFLDQLTPGGLAGNLLALCSGFTLGGMFLLSGRLPDDQSAQSALLLGHALTALAGIPVSLWVPTPFSGQAAAAIVVLGVVQLGIPYVLYGIAVRLCTPLTCSLIGMLEPLFNPLWVLLFVGERPGVWALVGGVIVLGAVCAWMLSNAAAATRQQEAPAQPEDITDSMSHSRQNM